MCCTCTRFHLHYIGSHVSVKRRSKNSSLCLNRGVHTTDKIQGTVQSRTDSFKHKRIIFFLVRELIVCVPTVAVNCCCACTCNVFNQLIKLIPNALEYIHNRCMKFPPTCFSTPWEPSSGGDNVFIAILRTKT